ncbi:hypothetical protein CS533_07225 [Yersinia bercovieri]|uniref:Uncharacterized protein n=1 Tax=Yersinia bercovieri TaxID=634 RepID=A0A2G4U462_YERBE|nr:hypothetical protein [Yersinia bercovieri]PHZ28042.1 hypothetical protein CS533_07225 [Yersinia bercovieri]
MESCTKNNFALAIDELHKNARRANMISISMTYFIIIVVMLMFSMSFYVQKNSSFSSPLANYITELFGNSFPKPAREVDDTNVSADKISLLLKSIDSLEAKRINSNVAKGISDSISKLVITLSLAFFAIYAMKISIMFIKYYSQLSNHYNSLAAAFIASNGDFEKAIKLIEVLSSSHISMGKTPDTIYEDTIKTLTKAILKKQ